MRRNSIELLLCVLSGVMLLSGARLDAQSSISGAISGVVNDSSGAVLPGAVVMATNTATADTSRTTTNASGSYQFTALQPSKYVVKATAAAFGTTSENAVVNVGQTTSVNFRLAPAGTNQTVEVSGELASTLQTSNADMATTLTSAQVQQVPVPGNDINALLQMAPGAVMTGDVFPSLYGQTTNSNLLISNGMEEINPYGNSTNGGSSNLLLGLNEVEEITIAATAYSGQFGYLAGSNDTIVTKSGTNRYHGNAKYFWNGRAMNANDYFNNEYGTPRSFVNSNQWSASLGGPIKRDKLFFFVDTEGIRLVLPTSQHAIIPSQQFEAATIENLQRLGLIHSIPFYCQGLTLADGNGNQVVCPSGSPGSGNGIFNLYNSAQGASRAVVGNGNPTTDPDGCNGFTGLGSGVPCSLNYYSTASNFNPEWILATRVDWNVNDNNHVFGHFKFDDGTQASYTDSISSIFNSQSAQKVEEGQFSWTRVLGMNAVNEFNMSAQHYHILFSPTNLSATLAAFPTQLVFGDGSFTTLGGQDGGDPTTLALTDYHFSDNFSKTINTHSLKAGYDFTRYDLGNSYFANSNGVLVPSTADAFFSGGIDPASPSTNYSTLTQSYATNTFEPFAQYHMGGYLQDEWKTKDNLTLSLSLRLDHASNPVCGHNCFARTTEPFSRLNHDADIPYNHALQSGLRESLYQLQEVEWQPRLGLAWQPLGIQNPMVVRGGVGLFYDNVPINISLSQAQNSPLINTFVASNGPLAPTQSGNLFAQTAMDNAAFSLGFSQGYALAQFQAKVPNFSPPQVQEAAAKLVEPLVTKWNLEVQRGLWRGAVVTAGYVGNHTIHGWVQNGSVNAFAANFTGLPAMAPDPRFGTVTIMEDVAVSNYNGGLFSFVDRLGGSVIQFNYTYSHALTDGIGTSNPRYIENPANPGQSFGNANFDVHHSITANYVWTVPFARYLPAVPKAIADGWQLSETFYIHSGFPYSVYDNGTGAALEGQNYSSSESAPAYGIFANFLGGRVGSCNSPKRVCLTSAQFSSASGGFGDQELNQFRGPHYVESDLGLMKMTRIPAGDGFMEGAKFGIGVQAYNVFNHPNFALPDGNLDDPNFGQITAAVGSPSSIYGLLGADNSPRLLQIKAVVEF